MTGVSEAKNHFQESNKLSPGNINLNLMKMSVMTTPCSYKSNKIVNNSILLFIDQVKVPLMITSCSID